MDYLVSQGKGDEEYKEMFHDMYVGVLLHYSNSCLLKLVAYLSWYKLIFILLFSSLSPPLSSFPPPPFTQFNSTV